jgi:hypothetical protein
MNDYLTRFVYDDNIFDAYEASAQQIQSISSLTATGIQYGQLIDKHRNSSTLYTSTLDHKLPVPQLLATVDTGSDIHLWTLDVALKFFQDQQISKIEVIGVGNQIQTATLQGIYYYHYPR